MALASCCLGELLGPYQDVPCGQVNLKEQGQLVRQDEFTIWLGRRKCQRHVFLFEDLILFSKPKRIEGGFDVYIYKRSFKVRAALQIALGQEVAVDFSLKVACLLSSGQLSPGWPATKITLSALGTAPADPLHFLFPGRPQTSV